MKMPRLISVRLLGLCLLLSQLPGEIQGEKMSDVVQGCSYTMLKYWIRLCGASLYQRKAMMRDLREAEPPTETKPTANENQQLASVNNYTLSELISKGSDKLIKKQRETVYDLLTKCCNGEVCSNEELLSFC